MTKPRPQAEPFSSGPAYYAATALPDDERPRPA